MKALIQRALASSLLRNMTVLTSGAVLAQMIPLMMLPVYSRMFSADMFAIQALLQLGMLIAVPIATGYYEWAIPIPRQRRQAHALATLVITFSFALCFALLLAIGAFREPLLRFARVEAIGLWAYAYPLIILGTAMLNLSNYWLLRQGKFTLQSLNRVVLSATAASVATLGGLLGWKEGLVIGFVVGTGIGGAFALYQAWRQGLRLRRMPRPYIRLLLRKYSEFPSYGSVPVAINNLAAQLPLLIITSHYTLAMTGHYAVARNLLSGGVMLISGCIGQVVLKHIADLAKNNKRIWPHYLRIMALMTFLGIGLAGSVYVIGPRFFTLYLGEGWSDSADITRILSLNLMLWLVGSSLAVAPIALRKLKAIALWQLLYGALACCLLFFTGVPFKDFIVHIAIFEAVAYLLYIAIITVTMWRHDRAHHRIRPTVPAELQH